MIMVMIVIMMMIMIGIITGYQVEFKWIRLGLAAKWEKAVEPALRLATVQVCFIIMMIILSSC